jgi:hypothetical protein
MVTLSVSVVVKSFDGLEESSSAKMTGDEESKNKVKSVYNPADFKVMVRIPFVTGNLIYRSGPTLIIVIL